MYETRFGLHRKPFQAVLTSDDFFESESYADLSATVIHALRSDLGVAVLTGPSGTGKTVTLDAIRRTMSAENQVMVLRGGTVSTGEDLLHALHRRLLPPPGKKFESTVGRGTAAQAARWEVIERMQKVSDFWGPTIVLLDDAHLTQPELFVELRALMEEEADGQRLLRVMIAGPLSLEEFLATPPLQDFSQRIRTHRFLEPLSSAESVAYLDHQLSRVGGQTGELFETAAVERIVAAADGVPRCLDLLADESLMSAFRLHEDQVSVAAVDDGLSRLRHLPYAWNVSLYSAASEADAADVDVPTTTAVVSHGVIEVGAPAAADEAPAGDTEIREERESRSATSSAAIEIGGDAATDVEEIVDLPQASASASEPTDNDPPIDPDARFDRIFQAISLAGGSVAVAPVVRDAGAELPDSAAEDVVAAAQSADVENPPSAGGSSVTEAMAALEIGDAVTTQGGDGSVANDDVSLEHHMILSSITDPETLDSVPAVAAYRPWQPPGTWAPGTSAPDVRTPAVHSARALATTADAVRQDLDVCTANASPVFDRYTWCELGRAVTPDPVNRGQLLPAPEPVPVWPPTVMGVAPVDAIAVETVAADGTVIHSDSLTMLATLPEGDPAEARLASAANPAESISVIQDLLEDNDATGVASGEVSAGVSHDGTQPESSADDAVPNTGRLFTLPIDVSTVDAGQPPVAPGDRSQQDGTDGPQASLLQQDQQEELLIASSQACVAGDEESEETLQVFVGDRAARQTRQSVVSLAADQLRMAAGAESLTETTRQTVLDVTSGPAALEQTEPSDDQGRFASLFTRLRRGRRR